MRPRCQGISWSSTIDISSDTQISTRSGQGKTFSSYRKLNPGPLLFCLLLLLAIPAQGFDGLVVSIADGDTLTVLSDHRQVKVRLADIDAPERGMAYAQQSLQTLAALCLHKRAAVEDQGPDRYGRTVGRVSCNGIDASAAQVRSGMAWVFEKYAPPESPLYTLQERARTQRTGLWRDTQPVAPWAWREAGRSKRALR